MQAVPTLAPPGATATDPSVARAKPIDFRAVRAQMPPREATPATLREFFVGQYAAHLAKKRRNTQTQYRIRWNAWIEPAFGDLPLAEITPWVVEEWLRWLCTSARTVRWADKRKENHRELSPAYIHQLHCSLSGILTRAVRMGLIPYNPARSARDELPPFDVSKATKLRPRRWTREEAVKFFSSRAFGWDVRAERAAAFYGLLRVGEMCGLRWRCVKLDDPIPHLVIEKSFDGPTKNGKTRLVPIHPELLPMLREWVKGWRKRFGRRPEPADLVFPSKARTMRKTLRVGYYEDLRRAEVPLIRHHGLRHSCAQIMRESGMAKHDIATLLGHTSDDDRTPEVTHTYVRDSLPVLAGIMAKFPGIFLTECERERARSVYIRSQVVDRDDPSGVDLTPQAGHGNNTPNAAMETQPMESQACSESRTTLDPSIDDAAPDTVRDAVAPSLPPAFEMLIGLFGGDS